MNSTYLRAACLLVAGTLWFGSQSRAQAQDANREAVRTVSDARDLVDRVAKRSGEFREEFEKAIEHSMMDGSKIEDRAKRRGQDLNESAKKLKTSSATRKIRTIRPYATRWIRRSPPPAT